MTALNIRKNLAGLLYLTADTIVKVKAPKVPSKGQIQYRVDDLRRKVANKINPDT
jgi:hypothetical protein